MKDIKLLLAAAAIALLAGCNKVPEPKTSAAGPAFDKQTIGDLQCADRRLRAAPLR